MSNDHNQENAMFEQLGSLLGGNNANTAELVGQLLQSQGGLQGLIDKLQQGGLGELAQSWVGNGQNLPISAEQLQAVLGSDAVQQLAGQFGLDASQLAALLPQAVDSMTPNGQLDNEQLLNQGLGMLGKLFS
ncbi:YidB family protein [Chitinibacteraceae bacterium HSL-7]